MTFFSSRVIGRLRSVAAGADETGIAAMENSSLVIVDKSTISAHSSIEWRASGGAVLTMRSTTRKFHRIRRGPAVPTMVQAQG